MKFFAVQFVFLLASIASGTVVNWETLRTSGFAPPLSGSAPMTLVGNKLYRPFGQFEPYFGLPNTWYNTTHSLDLQTNEWVQVPATNPPTSRGFHCAFEKDGRLLAWGGSQYNSPVFLYFNDLHALDLTTNNWEEIEQSGDIPSPRGAAACVQVGNKAYLAAGGQGIVQYNDVYELDLDTFTWTRLFVSDTTSSAFPRGRVSAALGYYAPRNALYLMVGEEVAFVGGTFVAQQLDDVWKFSLETGAWSEVAHQGAWIPPVADSSYTSDSGRVYIYGGDLESTDSCCGTFPTKISDSLWVFSMKSEKFKFLPQGRTGAPPLKRSSLALVGSELFVVGGYDFDAVNEVGPIANPNTYVRSLEDLSLAIWLEQIFGIW